MRKKRMFLIWGGIALLGLVLCLTLHSRRKVTITYKTGDTTVTTSSTIPWIQHMFLEQAKSKDSCTVTVAETETLSPTNKRTITY